MVKKIGVKDQEGNDVCIISNKNKIPDNFYKRYRLNNISWKVGDSMAFMKVDKLNWKNGYRRKNKMDFLDVNHSRFCNSLDYYR